ncbi:universal stress protein [Marisediminicola sp. LYQ85]|uniref:universal stress protein n=1 Tax=Marisediminicola sp. LYQ85 TaxID=3391062 RepID=UPI003983BC0E
MVEKVVAAVNGGPGSRAALEWVIARSHEVPMSLEITTVVETGPWTSSFTEEREIPAYERMLATAAALVSENSPGTKVQTTLRRGSTRHQLILASAGVDLFVIGTRESTGYFSGTLRQQVAVGAHCPVIVIPADWTPSGGHVVVGVDDDDTSDVALEFAAAEAERLGCTLHAVHAWHIPPLVAAEFAGTGTDVITGFEAAESEVIDRAVAKITEHRPNVGVSAVTREGPAAAVLTGAARGADLLVVGTHRRGMLPGLILGSVGHDLLISLPCPVAIVSHPDDVALDASAES